MRLFCFVIVLVLLGPSGGHAEDTLEQRWKRLKIEREELPPEENPVLGLKELLAAYRKSLEEAQGPRELKREDFLDYKTDPEFLVPAAELQEGVAALVHRGLGQFPVSLKFDEVQGISLFTVLGANRALAMDSFEAGDAGEACSHLGQTLAVVEWALNSEPNLLSYLALTAFQAMTFRDLLALYAELPSPELLARIDGLRRKHRHRKETLLKVIRAEALYSREYIENAEEALQKAQEVFPESWQMASEEPLKSCTFEQLLAMKVDQETGLGRLLERVEREDQWIRSGKPLAQGPFVEAEKREPKALEYYLNAPNGLLEIFEDCTDWPLLWSGVIRHRASDALLEVAIAWLRAEADGVEVTDLEMLVPKYLASLPADPADGEILRCIPEERLVYSIGSDLEDNRGEPEFGSPSLNSVDEPGIVIPIPKREEGGR